VGGYLISKPYKILPPVIQEISGLTKEKIKLFGSKGRC